MVELNSIFDRETIHELVGRCHIDIIRTIERGTLLFILTILSGYDLIQYHVLQPVVLQDGIPRLAHLVTTAVVLDSVVVILTADGSLDEFYTVFSSTATTHIVHLSGHLLAARHTYLVLRVVIGHPCISCL